MIDMTNRRSDIILMNKIEGWGIYDTVENSFIGFRKKKLPAQQSENKVKSIWTKENFAKSAFKEATGIFFRDQDRYIVRRYDEKVY